MSYQELTPVRVGRYDGYMDPSQTTEMRPQTAPKGEVAPAPLSARAKSLMYNAEHNIEEGDTERAENVTDARTEIRDKTKEKGQKNYTRDELQRVANTVERKSNPGEVMLDAEFVSSAAKILLYNIQHDAKNLKANQSLLEELQRKNIDKQAKDLADLIKSIKPDGENTKEESSASRDGRILGLADRVAALSDQIATYYERATISKEYDDPFRQVVSFEELMTKFNITMDDDRFRPGGEFSLLDINEYVDEFGREMSTETAHPENFYRWVMERAWFYHDFDPMKDINLFEGMYLVAGSRKLSMYEMLVDFNAYFTHRVPTMGELQVLEEDMIRAKDDGKFISTVTTDPRTGRDVPADPDDPESIGYYNTFIDPETGKPTRAYVRHTGIPKERTNSELFEVYYYDKDGLRKPVRAFKENKEEWQTEHIDAYDHAQEEIMYQLWLMTRNHNADIAYRQKGMPSEQPLKDVLAEINSDNIWTRTRRRLLGIMNMPASTYRGDVDKEGKPVNEAAMQWTGEYKGQGTMGKAFQRSVALLYHISEANAALEGYATEGVNPFYELFKGKDGTNGAEIFYKRLIQRTLFEDQKFGFVQAGYKQKDKASWENSNIKVEFFNELNMSRIPRGDGTKRARYEWEKADFVSFMTMSQADFLQEMAKRNMTADSVKDTFTKLREKYNSGSEKDKQRLQELHELEAQLGQSSPARRRAFLESLVGKAGIKQDALTKSGKDGFMKGFDASGGRNMDDLAMFAVGLFTKAYPTEFTPDINPYVNIRYSLEARERMRGAMRDALSYTEKLDEFDAKWAEEWAYTFTFHTGISARNDMLGIGHDAWSKIQNTEFYRLRQTNGGNYPGNLENLYGIHRLGTNMWEGLKVQEDESGKYDKTLYEVLTGLETRRDEHGNIIDAQFNINKDVKNFEFAGNAMRQFYADHVSHAIDLFIDITQKHEFNIDKIVSEDNMGRVIINHGEMQKLIDSTWKHLRYGFDNNGFLYDNYTYGWWYDEMLKDSGQISRTPHFGLKTLRDLMFSEEVQAMDMYKRTDVSGWSDTPENRMGKMARNVFAYLIKAQIEEHTKHSEKATLYSADQIALIADTFVSYASRVMRGEHGEAVVLSGFFTPEEMYRILVFAHAVLWKLYAREYGEDALGGIIAAIFQTMSIIMKETGAGITLGK